MSTMKSLGASLAVVGLLSGPAALRPPGQECAAYKVWSSGVMGIETIKHENQGSSCPEEAYLGNALRAVALQRGLAGTRPQCHLLRELWRQGQRVDHGWRKDLPVPVPDLP